jgi:hypothetical protein
VRLHESRILWFWEATMRRNGRLVNMKRCARSGATATLLAGLALVGVGLSPVASATPTIPDYHGHLATSAGDCDGVTTAPYDASADA